MNEGYLERLEQINIKDKIAEIRKKYEVKNTTPQPKRG